VPLLLQLPDSVSVNMNEEENEVSLLDVLLVVAENIRLLILGPLVVCCLSWGVGYVLPQTFTSQAILALPASSPTQGSTTSVTPTPGQVAALMVSPLVMDPVARSLGLYKEAGVEEARKQLVRQIKTTTGKDGLLYLEVSAGTPQEAQALANAVIDGWLKSTAPGVQDRADMEQRLANAKASLESVNALLRRLSLEGADSLGKPLTRGEAGTSLVAIGELQARYQSDVLAIPRAIQGLSRDVVIQVPTLPKTPMAEKRGMIAVLLGVGSGIALLLWVFLRFAWRSAGLDPRAAKKQAKLIAAMRFRRQRQ
jgi:capsular polysaccharide biosynthesis protein